MYALRRLWWLAVILGTLAAGCFGDGGRGSSGFDISENLIIVRVLETQECLTNQSLTFCPADQVPPAKPTPTATAPTPTAALPPTVTPTTNPTPQVDTGLSGGASIPCTRQAPGAPCMLTFTFVPLGFPEEATFRVASRLRAPDTVWSLAAVPQAISGSNPAALEALVGLDVPGDAGAPRVQFAVLAFLTPPASVPSEFEMLSETGTDFAFLTPEVGLEVITVEPSPTPILSPTASFTLPPMTPTATPSAPTATATATAPLIGPEITYFGVARADSLSLAPSAFDPQGRPIYIRPFGFGLSLVVEGRPGASGRPIGRGAYDSAGALPDLQLIVSRPLGDGSAVVCDNTPPHLGGVPATVPLAFSDVPAVVNAMNDLGCRVDDGAGQPVARLASPQACTLDVHGEYTFVDRTSSAQFCLPIAPPWGFATGDTIVAARLLDVTGNAGPSREIVVRNAGGSGNSPTPLLTPPTPPPTVETRTPTATAVNTEPPTPIGPSRTPTATPDDLGPLITHLGLARADDLPIDPSGEDADGRLIYRSRLGQGISLIVEARPGPLQRRVGVNGFNPDALPDLQLIVSRPLGNGSPILCDTRAPMLGGVPATDRLRFTNDPNVIAAINDPGCRVDDGTGQPVGRPVSQQACTSSNVSSTGYAFVSIESTVQYCLPIAGAWAFPRGDTIVAGRVRDIDGRIGATTEIVVRVGNAP